LHTTADASARSETGICESHLANLVRAILGVPIGENALLKSISSIKQKHCLVAIVFKASEFFLKPGRVLTVMLLHPKTLYF